MDRLRKAVELLDNAPDSFKRQALEGLAHVLNEYEDWLCSGSPDEKRWQMMKWARDPMFKDKRLQKSIRKVLRRMEE